MSERKQPGKTALITEGATTGIGLTVAKLIATRGAHVIILALMKEQVEQALVGVPTVTKSVEVDNRCC